MKQRLHITLLLVIITTLILTACGGASAKADIPLFPGATLDTGTYEQVRKGAEDQEIATSPEMNIEVKAYTTTASLEEVESYYNEQLADWTMAERSEDPTSNMVFMKWTLEEEQAFVIFYVPSGAIGADTVLMIEQAWPK